MTAPLQADLAAAYVHELSADVRAVVVLAADGTQLAGAEALRGPATALAGLLERGAVRTDSGVVWVARTAERTLVAVAGPAAQVGPTGLDVAAALGDETPVEAVENPSGELIIAARDVIMAT